MSGEKVYFKQTVIAEPLFNQWYAWPYLISPATAAMFTANLHMKIMQSFVTSPQLHIAAHKNPAMMGGPFINYDASRVGEIKSLLENTGKDRAQMLQLADAIKACDEMLKKEANGFSLEQHYAKIPEILKGYVELTYDLNNNAALRLIEALLYKSPYYDESSQSMTLSLVEKDERQFVFSTPRLPDDKVMHLRRPFKDKGYDELFKMKVEAQPLEYITELLNVAEEDRELFASFFTNEPPTPGEKYTGDDVRIRYLGHACILIETKDVSVLCDPVVSYKDPADAARYTYIDLPEVIDYVLITHNHADHCMFETLLQLRHRIKNIIVPKNNGGLLPDPSLKLVLQNIGFRNVREIDEMEEIEIAGGSITGLPFLGEHADLNIRSKTAHLVNLLGKSILCAADSNNIEPKLYKHIHDLVGDIDVLFIGMECDGAPLTWLYGPLLTAPLARKLDQSRRLDGSNCEKGICIVDYLNPTQVYVYAMGLEPWLTYLTSIQYTDESRPIIESGKLVEELQGRRITSERLYGQKDILLEVA
jgi:L-ascorbate metabolism protein UlaG (beta-lactamase superfamily)